MFNIIPAGTKKIIFSKSEKEDEVKQQKKIIVNILD